MGASPFMFGAPSNTGNPFAMPGGNSLQQQGRIPPQVIQMMMQRIQGQRPMAGMAGQWPQAQVPTPMSPPQIAATQPAATPNFLLAQQQQWVRDKAARESGMGPQVQRRRMIGAGGY